ncbi:hypothetical protein JCM5353_001549 [Sporobolomyces roseus]
MPAETTSQMQRFSLTLPTELIEEILQVGDLLKRDLSRCCLVSRQFLSPARKSLYANLDFFYRGHEPLEWPDAFPEVTTSLVVRALASNPELQRLASSISFYYEMVDGYHPGDLPSIDCDEILTQVLKLTPNLKHLKLDRHFSSPRQIEASGISTMDTITSIDINNLDEIGVEVLRHIQNLRKLRVQTLKSPSERRQSDPRLPNLQALEIGSACLASPLSISRRLEILHLPLRVKPVDYNLLPRLKHLHVAIYPFWCKPEAFPDLTGSQSLETLYLTIFSLPDPDPVEDNRLSQLLAMSPPNPFCLAFTTHVPYPYLLHYLDNTTSSPIHQIRLSPRCLSDPSQSTSIEALRLSCESQGIKLTFDLALPIDIFRS